MLGGGNGTSRLLLALKPLLASGDISALHALVLNADDGGSTGRLREQYDVSAMGDLTKCLVSLSDFQGDVRGDQFLQALDHRFDRGDFAGHTLRNIVLTSLEQISDIDAGIAMMSRLLQVPKYAGVVPITLRPLKQQVTAPVAGQQSLLGEGQHFISHNVNLQADTTWQPGDVRVTFVEKETPLNLRAVKLLQQATHIVIAPGHTYGTILPALALPALTYVLRENKAKIIAVKSLLTTPRQTTGWSGEDFIKVYETYVGRTIDTVIGNTGTASVPLVNGQDWIRFKSAQHPYELILEDVVSSHLIRPQAGDSVPRAVVVHDEEKLRRILQGVFL